MATLFISDLHLDQTRPEITKLFLDFLQIKAPVCDALYILGDFFEVWIGDDNHTPVNQLIIDALKAVTDTGTPVYIMHGNRDFMLGKKFMAATGCTFLKDPCVVDLYGEATLLVHGDSLCSDDKSHQVFRFVVQSRFIKWLYLSLPLRLRQSIANFLRAKSRGNKLDLTSFGNDVPAKTVIKMMQTHQVKQLIHGHIHMPIIQQFEVKKQFYHRIVLSDWHKCGNVLICEHQHQRLINFTGFDEDNEYILSHH